MILELMFRVMEDCGSDEGSKGYMTDAWTLQLDNVWGTVQVAGLFGLDGFITGTIKCLYLVRVVLLKWLGLPLEAYGYRTRGRSYLLELLSRGIIDRPLGRRGLSCGCHVTAYTVDVSLR